MSPYGLNPDLSDSEREELERANFAVLMTNQALLGNIPAEFVIVAVRLIGDQLHVRFVVSSINDEVNEAVDDVLSELDVFYSHLADAPHLEKEVEIAPRDVSALANEGWRVVYAAKID